MRDKLQKHLPNQINNIIIILESNRGFSHDEGVRF